MAPALAALASRELVLHPTEGLWGIGGDPLAPEVLERVMRAKAITTGPRPFVILVPDLELGGLGNLAALNSLGQASFLRLTETFWPGSLTLVLPAAARAPDHLTRNTPGGRTIALRQEAHPAIVALMRARPAPLLSTSANLSGAAAPESWARVPASIRDAATLLQGGPAPDGQPSTVVDLLHDPPRVLRAGRIAAEALWL